MNRFCFVFFAFALFSAKSFAQQPDCPRIYKAGDTLKTDPAPSYQWYKNGAIIPNAVQSWFKPDTSGDYSVAVGGTSSPKSLTLNPADLRVEVFDAKLNAVSGATVSVNGQTSTTDANGRTFLPNVVSGRTVVKVSQNGFFDGYSSVYKPTSGNAIVKIQLEKFSLPLTFAADSGGTVAAPSGLSIKFPANAFKNESTGESYSGEVKVYFNHRAPGPKDPLFSFAMPGGDFTAIAANGETVALTSYGFFNCELRGANGVEINLESGATADVQFRIPEQMRANAPTSVPLWAFDETAGTWKYDSELTRNGIFYKGKVSHFSSWNCDYSGPACTVVAHAKDCNGNPAANVSLCFVGGVCGVTDSTGQIIFPNVPANQTLTLVSNQDTIHIAPVNAGETFTVAQPILAGESMLAYAQFWQDSVQISTYGVQPPVQYSLNGKNWQTEPLFSGVPFQDSVTVWVKDSSGCPITYTAFYSRVKESSLCRAAKDSLELSQFSTTWDLLLDYNLPVLYQILGETAPPADALLAYALNRHTCLAILDGYSGTITNVPSEIGNLSALTSLNLSSNQLTSLPSEIGALSALTILSLNANQLASLPPEIGNLSALTEFFITGNQLTSLPPEIGNLSALKSFSLTANQLTSLPPEIGNLSALKWLSFNSNQLTSLPPEIGNLAALTSLALSFNQLTCLPPEIGNLSALTWLYLQNNTLTSLPPEIGNLFALTSLDLISNQLTSLPPSIGNLSALSMFNLGYNQLTSLPPEIAGLADTLQYLYLQNNPIPVGDRPYYQSLLPNTTITW